MLLVNEYANKVYDNILNVTTGNAFKIGDKIGFKEESDKINIDEFYKEYMLILKHKLRDDMSIEELQNIRHQARFTLKAMQDNSKKGANKKAIFDVWVLDIRTLR